MRKYRRAIAHANMKKQGIKHVNKPRRDVYGRILPSLFSECWRKFC